MGMECARAVVWVFWSWAMYGSNDTIEELFVVGLFGVVGKSGEEVP